MAAAQAKTQEYIEDGKTTPVGFEPTRGDPIGLAGRRLNRSAKVSSANVKHESNMLLGLKLLFIKIPRSFSMCLISFKYRCIKFELCN